MVAEADRIFVEEQFISVSKRNGEFFSQGLTLSDYSDTFPEKPWYILFQSAYSQEIKRMWNLNNKMDDTLLESLVSSSSAKPKESLPVSSSSFSSLISLTTSQ